MHKFNKSKWFIVATEGATCDGRTINRSWIEQMAKNYDPKKYGARINIEHIKFRMIWKDEPHSLAYGDVTALKTEENAEGKLQLLAQLDPTDALIALNKDRQKIYTSVEIDPNFADSGEAYLVGLAVTDNPASLGTEMLQFSAVAHENPLAARKLKPENVFTAAVAQEFEFVEVADEVQGAGQNLLEKLKAMFSKKEKTDDARFAQQAEAIELLAAEIAKISEKQTALEQISQQQDTLLANQTEQLDQLHSEATDFRAKFDLLESQPAANYTPRPLITGAETESDRYF